MTGAIRGLRLAAADVIVVASPHGAATGVYSAPAGDLDAFGPRGITAAAPAAPDLTAALARGWDRPLLAGPADHGVVVPLRLLGADGTPVVAVAFREDLALEDALAEAKGLVRALRAVDAAVAFVASAHTSAGLTQEAPFPSLPGAKEADDAALAALRDDPVALLASLDALTAAGSCSAANLAAFAELCAGRACEVLAYDFPFGVGYAVAVAVAR